jgi:hypothetical protein
VGSDPSGSAFVRPQPHLRRDSATSAPGLGHICAGTRPHPRRDSATSALGLGHIRSGTRPHPLRDSATSAPGLRRYEGDDELFRSEYVSSLKAFRPTQVGVLRRPSPVGRHERVQRGTLSTHRVLGVLRRPSPVGRHERVQRAPRSDASAADDP